MSPAVETVECDTTVRLTNGNGNATGIAPVCSSGQTFGGSDGQIYASSDRSMWQVDCNVLFSGGDLYQRNASTFQVCIDACDAYGSGCAGVSWVPTGWGTDTLPQCFLQSGIGSPATDSTHDVYSAVRLSKDPYRASSVVSTAAPICNTADGTVYTGQDGSQYQIMCNADDAGNHMSAVVTSDLATCVRICDSHRPTCAGVTWVRCNRPLVLSHLLVT